MEYHNIKTVIEISTGGDFDICTYKIMVSSDSLNPKELAKSFADKIGVDNLDALPYNMVEDVREGFVDYLKKLGFRELKTTNIYIGD